MQVIMSHVNTDFDALASMIAAKKLYPDAQVVISNEKIIPVKQFLNIYRDTFELVTDNLVEWSEVTEVILVDTASFSRINEYTKDVNKITVYDHHTDSTSELTGDDINIEPVGAAVTLLIEKIMNRDIEISSFEATLFGLGLYGDTGSFKYPNTTIRDFKAAEFLIKNGMNLKIIQQFTDYKLTSEQQTLLNEVFSNADTFRIDGLKILVSTYEMEDYQMGLATVTNKLLDITGADTVITVVQMKKHVYIVGRVKAERITLLPLLEEFGGGGHDQAGSATVKYSNAQEVYKQVIERLNLILKPAITARDIMSRPVKTLPPETTIEEAGRLMYRYGHSGYPVVEDNELIGITTRRDLDKANHHNLGHAPIKAYMSTDVITIDPDKTIEEMQKLIIQHNIGRLPVIQDDELIGIVTRTNIIEMIHNKEKIEGLRKPFLKDLHEEMKQHLPEEIYNILNDIRKSAREADIPVYLVGGIVRDIFLKRQNDDIDIVVEGDGIHFLKRLEEDYGGDITIHKNFGTGTWQHPSGQMIDVTSARLEYYSHPASLPDVETSTLPEDLYRRDFTINSMAVSLNSNHFGRLVDPFNGQDDLRRKKIRVLHNLSFIDDPTRILRAVRFEMRFDFKMDQQTENLVYYSIGRLKDLSKDRLIDQMKRLFKEGNPSEVIRRLFELNFWKQFDVNEEVENSVKQATRLSEVYEESMPFPPNWFSYFVIPFYNNEKLYIAEQYAVIRQDRKILQDIRHLSVTEDWKKASTVGDAHRFLKDDVDEAVLFILSAEVVKNKEIIITYLQRRENLPVLLTGDDLIKQGFKPGPDFRGILMELNVAVLNKKISTRDEALIWLKENYVL